MTGKYLKRLLPIFGLVFTIGCQKDIQLPPNSIETELDKAIERGFDGVTVYVNQAGNTTFYSAGFNNRENQTPADPHALFKIASISKLYIAAATAKLVTNESLNLSSTLNELIPEVADKVEYSDEITLEMMVQHRSGIPEYIYHPEFENSDPEESYLTTAELIFNQPADFAPGQGYGYSNTNYLFLGEILDRTLGYSHHEYIKNELLLPLGLTNTYSLYSEVDSNEVASGYYMGYDPDLKSVDLTRPGGSMIATAEDVGIFLRALIDGTLLNAEEQAIYSSIYIYEHTGWAPGYTSIARYNSDIDAIVVQFVNTSRDALFWADLEGLYERINQTLEKRN